MVQKSKPFTKLCDGNSIQWSHLLDCYLHIVMSRTWDFIKINCSSSSHVKVDLIVLQILWRSASGVWIRQRLKAIAYLEGMAMADPIQMVDVVRQLSISVTPLLFEKTLVDVCYRKKYMAIPPPSTWAHHSPTPSGAQFMIHLRDWHPFKWIGMLDRLWLCTVKTDMLIEIYDPSLLHHTYTQEGGREIFWYYICSVEGPRHT